MLHGAEISEEGLGLPGYNGSQRKLRSKRGPSGRKYLLLSTSAFNISMTGVLVPCGPDEYQSWQTTVFLY